ncbi:MAG: IS66 family insertion sequence element accessory protein TnpB [Hyphomicrobiaceae bacterium]
MWQKRLEKERFKWPVHLPVDVTSSNSEAGGQVIVLDGQQLNWLLDGYDLAAMRPHRSLCYRTVL